jgi:hypothetical protein
LDCESILLKNTAEGSPWRRYHRMTPNWLSNDSHQFHGGFLDPEVDGIFPDWQILPLLRGSLEELSGFHLRGKCQLDLLGLVGIVRSEDEHIAVIRVAEFPDEHLTGCS